MSDSEKRTDQQNEFDAYFRRGTQLLQRREVDKAAQLLAKAVALDPHHVDAAINLAGAYILSKQFKQAVAVLEPMAEQFPTHAMVWTNLGAAYLGNPVLAKDVDQQQAIAAFEKALTINPAAPNVAYNIGLIYRDRQEFAAAHSWFRRAVQANPADQDARSLMQKMEDKLDSTGS